MTDDPRVEAVAEALRRRYRADEPFTPAALAPIAVAALDAYDRETAPVSRDHKWLDFHHAAWEADLRERIAREIEAMADEYRTHDEIDSMQGEVKDQLHAAVRIARGTDPGKDTR